MKTRPFGAGGPAVSALGQGTWRLDEGDRRTAIAALRAGLDAGMTHVDTAEMYGEAEPLVAEAIAGRRDEVFLVSKVLPSNASRNGTVAACEGSLRRLRTDRLDCYLLHWRGSVPLAETIDALAGLVESGKIAAWGVSNFDVDDLEEALAIAGPGRIACNQILHHLEERAIEHAVLPWCQANGVAVVGYSPFGSGDFSEQGSPGRRVLDEIACAHEADARQVALAFLLRSGTFPIPKASSTGHARRNAAAADLVLSDTEHARIDRAFPRGPKPRSLPML